jgi:BirA family transcriptional regulator, biotin operon repressor / biotin---[acetyl-CoA-carboxylase] ligase
MSSAQKILALLKANKDSEISSRTFCAQLKISRNAVWKHITALRKQGYVIEGQSRCGYRLVSSPSVPCAAEVTPLLHTESIGRILHYKKSCISTNDDAMAAAEQGCAEGAVFCAGAQSGGRGRMNRQWFSPADANLYFSILLRPGVTINRAAALPLIVGIAVTTALEQLDSKLHPRIKWPNDIQIDGKKICGILCEMRSEIDCRVRHIVAGVGLNVNLNAATLPADLCDRATSLLLETGREFPRAGLLAAVLNVFEPLYHLWQREGFAGLTERMAAYDALAGEIVSIQQGRETLTGRACGVREDGALLLKTAMGVTPVYSGEVHKLRTNC